MESAILLTFIGPSRAVSSPGIVSCFVTRLGAVVVHHHHTLKDWLINSQYIATHKVAKPHLGIMLFASSAVLGHRLASWAVSNWVKLACLRKVLNIVVKML